MADLLSSIPGMGGIVGGGIVFFIIAFVIAFLSLFGAIKMWNLKKVGFYMYTAAQVIMIILPFIFIPEAPVSIFGILVTAVFVLLYALNLKAME